MKVSENSGFLSEEKEFTHISASFSDVEVLGSSSANIYGRASRYGKRWFFKGVKPGAADNATARQRLLKEFDIQIGLVHPSVERVIGFERIEGIGESIISEWIEGDTLEEHLSKPTLVKADRYRILSEIIDAVGYLHSQGIVHRDLKPSNIMVRNNGQSAVVIDFGLADTDAHLYQKSPAGTEGYASNRQHHAHTPFTGDDIHALGVIMQQLCPELSSIARRCLAGRYPTAEALRIAIKRRTRRRKIMSIVAFAAVFIIAIVSLFMYIASLKDTAASLQSRIESMTDTITSVRASSRAANRALRDSLLLVSNVLDNERSLRLDTERRQAHLNELKAKLNRQLDRSFSDFRKTQDPADPDNLSLIRLIDRLALVKTTFLAKDIPFALSDYESSELEYSFVLHYNDILQQWNQILSQHRPTRSAD